jgi:hypothetical protein
MVFALTMDRLSACPFPILSERMHAPDQREALRKLLQTTSQNWPFIERTREETALMERSGEARFLLHHAEAAAMASFAAGDIKWGSGNHPGD